MPKLIYQGKDYDCREGESVLDALMRQGVSLSFSCRNGICQVCLQRCVAGTLPERAQNGVREELRAAGYFLPCRCTPQSDITIEPPRATDLYAPVVVRAKEQIAPNVVRLLIEPPSEFSWRAGQFVNLRGVDGLARSYSLAGLPQDYFLELHVQRKLNGVFSNWIFDELEVGDALGVQGPQGDCCYRADDPGQPLLLIGTGTGLAPLLGIARDALASGHRGEVHLYHGTRFANGLYLRATIESLAARHPNLRYHPCVSGEESPGAFVPGRADTVALRNHLDLCGWRVYLAGLPQMVNEVHMRARAAGARPEHVHLDPFEMKDLRCEPRQDICAAPGPSRAPRPLVSRRTGAVADADPEMWAALSHGELLQRILANFYTRVLADARLSPFFAGVTRQRLIEKQYLFLRQHFTGEKLYFGDRPRNAHHWMVISEELFDYREALMEDELRAHGLAPHLVERFLAFEASFRGDIVKAAPWKKLVHGVALPLDGFGELALDAGTLCDSCGGEIDAGTNVRYHLRTGNVYCPACMRNSVVAGASAAGTARDD
jgi:ferredoxin-NADP reductase